MGETYRLALSFCLTFVLLSCTLHMACGTGGDPQRVCDKLRDMFVSQDCLQGETIRCRLIAFRLSKGFLTKEPRCDFLPCEGYGQPSNQTCATSCPGTVIETGLCPTGQVCCVPSGGPTPCPYTCASSLHCTDTAPGFTCPYLGDVCCRSATDIFGSHPSQTSCAYSCTSSFNCQQVAQSGSCGFGFDVCCQVVASSPFGGSLFDTPSNFLLGGKTGFSSLDTGLSSLDTGLSSLDTGLSSLDGLSNLGSVGTHGTLGYISTPCPYTCTSAAGCAQVETSGQCSSSAQVCCRTPVTAVQPPASPKPPASPQPPASPKPPLLPALPTEPPIAPIIHFTLVPTPVSIQACAYTCSVASQCAKLDITAQCPSVNHVCCKQVADSTTRPDLTSDTNHRSQCPYECRAQLLCAEVDPNYSCDGRKVCCSRRRLAKAGQK